MHDYITPFNDILSEAQSYQDMLDGPFTNDVDTAIFEHGNTLSEIVSRTGKLQSDAQYWLNEAKRSTFIKELDKLTKDYGMAASVQKDLITSHLKSKISLEKWCERLNRTATHQLEWCRSKLSYLKEEINASRGMNNQNNQRNGSKS